MSGERANEAVAGANYALPCLGLATPCLVPGKPEIF